MRWTHRELSHRVKGLSVSTFSQQEVDALKNIGNGGARKIWLANYKESDFGPPDRKDTNRAKEFMCLRYLIKKWYAEPQAEEEVKQEKVQ